MSARKPPKSNRKKTAVASVSKALLAWYDTNRRELPWRGHKDDVRDPYRIWLSEIMLQQTTVAAVAPYYRAFLKRWPTVKRLAAVSQDDVLGAWAGLGYYSRARNLHRTAQIVAHELDGVFPCDLGALRKLPGIGTYTAAAIGAIAFDIPVAAIDANAERVIARLYAIEEPLPKAKNKIAERAGPLVPKDRPGDFAQALMDLGSGICLAKHPLCASCPLRAQCRAHSLGLTEQIPRRPIKAPRPIKRGAAFVAFDREGAVHLVRRPERGLLGAMLQPPLSEWGTSFPPSSTALDAAPFSGRWTKRLGFTRHVFTHFELEMEVYVARFSRRPNGEGQWFSPQELASAALPTVMRKAIAHALDEDTPLFAQLNSARTR